MYMYLNRFFLAISAFQLKEIPAALCNMDDIIFTCTRSCIIINELGRWPVPQLTAGID